MCPGWTATARAGMLSFPMRLSLEDALRSYASLWNTLDPAGFLALLAEDFIYESQAVLEPLMGGDAFADYIGKKVAAVKTSGTTVHAEMGSVGTRPCVILAQGSKDDLVALAFVALEAGRVKRLDLCMVPPPRTATRTGDYPR